MKDLKRVGIILGAYLVLFSIFFIHKKINSGPKLALEEVAEEVNVDIEHENTESVQTSHDIQDEMVFVHISGEVEIPGLLEVPRDTRLFEIVELSGGFTEDADIDRVNLAMTISDEDRIHIPAFGEESIEIYDTSSNSNKSIININRASKEELMTLPGIGEKTAESILEYRKDNKFNSKEDIKNVSGIGDKKYQDLENLITH